MEFLGVPGGVKDGESLLITHVKVDLGFDNSLYIYACIKKLIQQEFRTIYILFANIIGCFTTFAFTKNHNKIERVNQHRVVQKLEE